MAPLRQNEHGFPYALFHVGGEGVGDTDDGNHVVAWHWWWYSVYSLIVEVLKKGTGSPSQ